MKFRRALIRRYAFTLAIVVGVLLAATFLAVGPGNLRSLLALSAQHSAQATSGPDECGNSGGNAGQACGHECPPGNSAGNSESHDQSAHPEDSDRDADERQACEPCPPFGYGHPPASSHGDGDNDNDDCHPCPPAKPADTCS